MGTYDTGDRRRPRGSDHARRERDLKPESAADAVDAALAAGADVEQTLTDALAAGDAALAERFRAGDDTTALVRERADLADALIKAAWRHCCADSND
ncbi:MAG TPA: hypothetical protein VFH57_07035, partial [Gammaproteobacteria bacterium]|nr:hypothetical protein [Gammaproteobacteria bacterium]